jgi:(1->4)-alpha-D-glucan 1-alpha-D-glucosylmutase
MIKAVREAKQHSTWMNPDEEYEDAVRHFVQTLLSDPERSPFLVDFLPFQRRLARFGLLNGLTQTLLKLTVPGVPDVYQGNETWQFSLVDPDNRRPVDYRALQGALAELTEDDRDRATLAAELLERLPDGRAKLYVTSQALALRIARPALFLAGDYAALDALGPRAEHLCAFARRHGDEELLVAAGRWYARLAGEDDAPPVAGTWAGTRLALPTAGAGRRYRNLLDGRLTAAQAGEDGPELDLAGVFAHLPVALLLRE